MWNWRRDSSTVAFMHIVWRCLKIKCVLDVMRCDVTWCVAIRKIGEIRWYKDLWEMSPSPRHSWHCISVHQFQFVWMFPMLNEPVCVRTVHSYIQICGQAYVCSTVWWMCVCITDSYNTWQSKKKVVFCLISSLFQFHIHISIYLYIYICSIYLLFYGISFCMSAL